MRLAICTIQRDRAKWLPEWVAFHHSVGFTKFFIYLHNCQDNSNETVRKLMKIYDIDCNLIPAETDRPQLIAYNHAYQNFGDEFDWMAFIDGDEFLFSPKFKNIIDAINFFNYKKVSAIGVWWQCYSSNLHIFEPDGLIIENYTHRPTTNNEANRHFKSIVRGRQGDHFSVLNNAHYFKTLHGTFDELLRPLNHGKMLDLDVSVNLLRINHYVSQSYEYFKKFKQHSGAADAGKNMIRDEKNWRIIADDNSENDCLIHQYLPDVKRGLDLYNLLDN